MSATNRRDFFRLKTRVSLEIRHFEHPLNQPLLKSKISNTDLLSYKSTIEEVALCFNLPPAFNLIAEFQRIDLENRQLLRQISENDRQTGLYLKILNKKVDTLAKAVIFADIKLNPENIIDIDLSEGGLSVKYNESYLAGDTVAIKLILLPSRIALLLKGVIHSCKKLAETTEYDLRLEFQDLDDHQRQLIARHLIRMQSEKKQKNL